MELDVKKSKALKISLLVLAVIILLAIGSAIGTGFSYHRGYGCGGFDRFERNGRNNTMWNGRQDDRQFRMMVPQNAVDQSGQIQYINQVPAASSTQGATPVVK